MLTFAYRRLIVAPSLRPCIPSSFACHFHYLPSSCCSLCPLLLLSFLFLPDVRYPVDSPFSFALSFDLLGRPPSPPISSKFPFGTTCILLFLFYLLSAFFSKLPGLFLCSNPEDPFFSTFAAIFGLMKIIPQSRLFPRRSFWYYLRSRLLSLFLSACSILAFPL